MRMIDRRMDLDLVTPQRPVPGLVARLSLAATNFFRVWQNRRAMNRLNELDDRQLLDMGLRRGDVREVMTSSFFADTGLHLTIVSRERARRHLRHGKTD